MSNLDVTLFCILIGILLPQCMYAQSYINDTCRTPDGKLGKCVLSQQCQSLNIFLTTAPTPLTPQTLKILRLFHYCGPEPNYLNICCPTEAIIIDETKFYHRNMKLLPLEDCGPLPTGDRFSGSRTALFEYPWMALLSFQTGHVQDFRFAGTIINDRYILTAAHCLTHVEPSILVGVRVGEYNINETEDCDDDLCAPPFQDLRIEETIIHPNFSVGNIINDIGLIRVATPMNISVESVKPICLPLGDINANYTDKGFFVAGWGFTPNTEATNTFLLKTMVVNVNLESCANTYKPLGVEITDKQICAIGKNGGNVCEGDSGGPLQTIGEINKDIRFIQYGIISSGTSNCGENSVPAIYTRIDAYLKWILSSMIQ